MKNSIYLLVLLSLIFCSKEKKLKSEIEMNSTLINADSSQVKESTQLNKERNLEEINKDIIHDLKKKNYSEFSAYIHPEKGVTFSMYSNVNAEKDKHFSRTDFDNYLSKDTKFTWGEQDGTGDLLVLPLRDYLHDWVFKRDFTDAEFYENQFKGTGNTINTIKKFYPGAIFTENYIPGTELYSGMDWASLIFVFEKYEGKLYLVAVVNNSWTT